MPHSFCNRSCAKWLTPRSAESVKIERTCRICVLHVDAQESTTQPVESLLRDLILPPLLCRENSYLKHMWVRSNTGSQVTRTFPSQHAWCMPHRSSLSDGGLGQSMIPTGHPIPALTREARLIPSLRKGAEYKSFSEFGVEMFSFRPVVRAGNQGEMGEWSAVNVWCWRSCLNRPFSLLAHVSAMLMPLYEFAPVMCISRSVQPYKAHHTPLTQPISIGLHKVGVSFCHIKFK